MRKPRAAVFLGHYKVLPKTGGHLPLNRHLPTGNGKMPMTIAPAAM
jgi:hypothetical protein